MLFVKSKTEPGSPEWVTNLGFEGSRKWGSSPRMIHKSLAAAGASHSPWGLHGSSCQMFSQHLEHPPQCSWAAGKAGRFPWGFPSLRGGRDLFISRKSFCYNKSAHFTCPEIFPWEFRCWLPVVQPVWAFIWLCLHRAFSSEKLKVFLFTLQLKAESERQNSAGGSPALQNGKSTCNSCCGYFGWSLLGPWRNFPAEVSMEGREWCWGEYKHWSAYF